MPNYLLLFLIEVIISSFLFLLWLHAKLLGLHLLYFLVSHIFLSLIIDSYPFELLDFALNLIHQNFWREKFLHFSICDGRVQNIVNFSPFITLLTIYNNEGLSTSIRSCSSTSPVNISITIDSYSVLNNICYSKI